MVSTVRNAKTVVRGPAADECQMIQTIADEYGTDCPVSIRRYRDPLMRKRVEIRVFSNSESAETESEHYCESTSDETFDGALRNAIANVDDAQPVVRDSNRTHSMNELQERQRQLADDLERTLCRAEVDVESATATASEIVAQARRDSENIRKTSALAADQRLEDATRQSARVVAAAEHDRDTAHQRLSDATRRYDELVREGHATAEQIASDARTNASRAAQEQQAMFENAKQTADRTREEAAQHASSLINSAHNDRSEILQEATAVAEDLRAHARLEADITRDEANVAAKLIRDQVDRDNQDAQFARVNMMRDTRQQATQVRVAADGYRIKVMMNAKRDSLAMQERTAKLFESLMTLTEQVGDHLTKRHEAASAQVALMLSDAEKHVEDAVSEAERIRSEATQSVLEMERAAEERATKLIREAEESAAKIKRHARKTAEQRARRMERSVRRQYRQEIAVN